MWMLLLALLFHYFNIFCFLNSPLLCFIPYLSHFTLIMSESLSCYQYRKRYNRNLPFTYQSYLGKILNTTPGNASRKHFGDHSRHKNCVCCAKSHTNYKVRELKRIFDSPQTIDNDGVKKRSEFNHGPNNFSKMSLSKNERSFSVDDAFNPETSRQSVSSLHKSGPETKGAEQKEVIPNQSAAQAFPSHSLPVRANLSNYTSTSCRKIANENPQVNEYTLRKPRSVYSASFRSLNSESLIQEESQINYEYSSTAHPIREYPVFSASANPTGDHNDGAFLFKKDEQPVKPNCNIDMFSITDSDLEKEGSSVHLRLSKLQRVTDFDRDSLRFSPQSLISHNQDPIISCSKGQVSSLRERFERNCSNSPSV